MKRLGIVFCCLVVPALAASKPHTISFGKVMPVKWFTGPSEDQPRELRIRPLYVDSKLREFTIGDAHDVTDRTFVVRRAYRINDVLPDESGPPKWKWQRGGWLMVERQSGHISAIKLPDFDPYYSAVTWYRDYAAYCGISSDAEKRIAIVVEIGRKKPVLHQPLGAARGSNTPDSECAPPQWQRQPARVVFHPEGAAAVTFNVSGGSADVASPDDASAPHPESEPKDEN